jgi:hypothetical protein
MKKIFAILAALMCAVMVCTMPVVALDDGVANDDAVIEPEETPSETPQEPPTETPTETPDETPSDVRAELTTEMIVDYIKNHFEELSVILSMVLMVFYQARKHLVLNRSIAMMNNNTVSVAQNSAEAIANSVNGMAGMTDMVTAYKGEMEKVLTEVRANAEEKNKMAVLLNNVNKHLEVSKAANLEFANEMAELLVLANIPPSKKEELYARHVAAVNALSHAEHTEVNHNDGEEA